MSKKKVRFIAPPSDKQIGGIAAALVGLEQMLVSAGFSVARGADIEDSSCIHHVHGLWNLSNSLTCLQLQKRGLPYIVSPHGMLEPWALANKGVKKRIYLSLLERRVLEGARKVFVTSDMERKHAGSLLNGVEIEVHPLGSDYTGGVDYLKARQRLGWQSHEQVILFLSRVDPKKGLDLLIDALNVDGARYEDVSLVVVGGGEPNYMAQLERQSQVLRDRLRRVSWVGPVWGEDRWSYLQGADLFCLPTHSENFGIVVLEALLAGTPVLTTDKTPWKDCIRHGLEITSPNLETLKSDLSRMIGTTSRDWTHQERQELSSWARDQFSWEKLAQSYADSYQQIFTEL
ncbi:glycosyltransferase [Hyphomonas sp.]|uniref:glycosyltransferase n=1 Tax=Hyphomonas sp. TaxID=87 RepID=UPI0025BA191E|nr:glycosyltransferase [Hyphomonas sp.]MBI1399412.1 glycosyltransferase [Hyphomonas sp.]